jgi:hypothetical protein
VSSRKAKVPMLLEGPMLLGGSQARAPPASWQAHLCLPGSALAGPMIAPLLVLYFIVVTSIYFIPTQTLERLSQWPARLYPTSHPPVLVCHNSAKMS